MQTPNEQQAYHDDSSGRDCDQFVRVPGIFRRWEFEFVIEPGFDYHIEEHGRDTCGTRLFAIYKRESPEEEVSA